MTADPDCVTPDATLAEAWDRMSRGVVAICRWSLTASPSGSSRYVICTQR